MRGRIKESYWVITKISLGDNITSGNSREVLTNLIQMNNMANESVYDNYCSVN